MASQPFPRLVSLACHDLRTPLATVYGFARTLTRTGDLDERSQRFLGMIEEASEQMTELLDLLGVAARIEAKRWDPALREANTLELVTSDDERIAVSGEGETIETEPDTLAIALRALAVAASRYGPAERVTWEVRGRQLALSPLLPEAARRRDGRGAARPRLARRAHGDRRARRLAHARGRAAGSRSLIQPWNAATSGSDAAISRPPSITPRGHPALHAFDERGVLAPDLVVVLEELGDPLRRASAAKK